mmetsp:Transcript_8773/g.17187  ORF Transcript_8773/g.17187 Transcript_8773/m.17187 type:complete len:500 (-) Transcript_8773:954-2453(-)
MADVAVRLEAVVSRLEKLADSLAAGGGAPAPAGGAAASADQPKFVDAYETLFDEEIKTFIGAAAAIKGCAELEIDSMATTFYSEIGKVMKMAGACKKPDQKALMEIMKPVTQLFPKAENASMKRGKCMNHAIAWKEMLAMVNFLFVPKPRGYAEEAFTQPDMYLNKILTAAKKQEGDEKTKNQAFVKAAKAVGVGLKDYIKQYHAAEVSWNKKGVDAKSWTPGGAPAAGGAPPPPPGMAPPPMNLGPPPVVEASSSAPTKAAPGGMAAVFAQINKGSSQCESAAAGGATAAFKLKKVTKEMKKAMKKEPALKPKESKKKPKKAVAAPKKKVKPPSCEFRQGTWWVENQVEDKEVNNVELKHNVYIYNANRCTITIPGKIKSITMDKCTRAKVIFDQVISTFEVVGCDACKVFCQKQVPSVAIDKSKGTQVNFSVEAAQFPPDIVTSNISETNIVLPGANPDGDPPSDPIEIPLPEQYITKITGQNGIWETDTTMVTHGG